ncbi:hypothetical protein [Hutsoniella sourekii]|uniref:hypothetical protein n=1 Tax=Hutsoniella sourekii TaxID=87650 RepID=UPI000487D846|nr:hypothetical protein [Hutsoniella sourekii]
MDFILSFVSCFVLLQFSLLLLDLFSDSFLDKTEEIVNSAPSLSIYKRLKYWFATHLSITVFFGTLIFLNVVKLNDTITTALVFFYNGLIANLIAASMTINHKRFRKKGITERDLKELQEKWIFNIISAGASILINIIGGIILSLHFVWQFYLTSSSDMPTLSLDISWFADLPLTIVCTNIALMLAINKVKKMNLDPEELLEYSGKVKENIDESK